MTKRYLIHRLLKNSYPALTAKLLSLNPAEAAISSITIFELEYGAAKSKWGEKTRQNLAMFLAPFSILPFDGEDAAAAGTIRAYLEQQGSRRRQKYSADDSATVRDLVI